VGSHELLVMQRRLEEGSVARSDSDSGGVGVGIDKRRRVWVKSHGDTRGG